MTIRAHRSNPLERHEGYAGSTLVRRNVCYVYAFQFVDAGNRFPSSNILSAELSPAQYWFNRPLKDHGCMCWLILSAGTFTKEGVYNSHSSSATVCKRPMLSGCLTVGQIFANNAVINARTPSSHEQGFRRIHLATCRKCV